MLKNAMLSRITKFILIEFPSLLSGNILKTFSVFNLLLGISQSFLRSLTCILDFPFTRLIVKLFFEMLTKTNSLICWSFISPPYLEFLLIFLHDIHAVRHISIRLHFLYLFHCLLLPSGLCTFGKSKCFCH